MGKETSLGIQVHLFYRHAQDALARVPPNLIVYGRYGWTLAENLLPASVAVDVDGDASNFFGLLLP